MSLNVLPFQILFDGKLQKDNPFEKHTASVNSPINTISKVINSSLSNSFRGRKLNGRKIHLCNSKHLILILHKDHSRKKLDLNIEKSLNQMTYWNYDEEIQNSDDIPQFLNTIYYYNILQRET